MLPIKVKKKTKKKKKKKKKHTLESAFTCISSIASTLNYSLKRFSEFYMFILFSNLLEEIPKIIFYFHFSFGKISPLIGHWQTVRPRSVVSDQGLHCIIK